MAPGAAPLRILLVEPDEQERAAIENVLLELGLTVFSLADGRHAARYYDRERPEILICSSSQGIGVCLDLLRNLRDHICPVWLPAIVVGSDLDPDERLQALEAGADDFLTRPLSPRMLLARIRQAEHVIQVQRRSNARARELQLQSQRRQEEEEMARHVMERLINAESLSDPALNHWIASTDTFCGDLVAAARTPGDVLHVLLADGTGHGLAASLNVLPVISPFYRMTEKGFPVEPLIREVNRHVRQILPSSRFVAATLAAVNFRAGVMHLWNGGNPQPVLVDRQGRARLHKGRPNLALGIVGGEDFDGQADLIPLSDLASVVICSDGVLEAENSAGEAFGHERMLEALSGPDPRPALERLLDAVHDHLGGRPARDDLSVAVIDCSRVDVSARAPLRPSASAVPQVARNPATQGWRCAISLSAEDLKRVAVVPVLIGVVEQFQLDAGAASRLFIVLTELFGNALEHGLLGLLPAPPAGSGASSAHYMELDARLHRLERGSIDLEIECRPGVSLVVRCRDSGTGIPFDTASASLHFGEGLRRAAQLCTRLEFLGCGNVVEAHLDLTARD